jgi:ATP adenylyltransferase
VTLLERARAAVARARADGSLRPLASTAQVVPDGGVDFVVRQITAFEHKPHGSREDDPFRPPWTNALFVEDWGPAHALLLNKYPVLDDHLLLVTRDWADQEAPPTAGDLSALGRALDAMDALWFYNGGRAAGASQPHRHLQLVPRASLGGIPLEALLRDGARGGRVAAFAFRHAVVPGFDPDRILAALGPDPGPHTLLGTREAALIVPRSAPKVDGEPVNSLAYAGFLAARSEAGLAAIRRRGPFAVLAAAATPAQPRCTTTLPT